MANLLTGCRLILTICMTFTSAFSEWFYIFYVLCGLSDMLDGYIARKTKTESEFGAKFDSVADTAFTIVCLLKILPNLTLEPWILIWIAIIAMIRFSNIVSGYILHKAIIMLHTTANKITGFLLFVFPLLIAFAEISFLLVPVCATATFAAIQEGRLIRNG